MSILRDVGDDLSQTFENINAVKKQLGMSITPINDAEDVLTNTGALFELISTMESFPIDSLQAREWFDKYDEATDNALTEVLELHNNDLVDIHQTVESIVESLKELFPDLTLTKDEEDYVETLHAEVS